ncbi:MAG TPA: HAMP domain-containing sensor histidine kinase [Gemmatimonadales bacterium]|nr:HAMP domain-containing sensor histidine kinase [Gemmatimonadales bacterium]
MTTIRGTLTVWFMLALGLALAAMGAALYVDRKQSAAAEVDAQVTKEVGFARRWLSESHRVLGRVVTTDSVPSLVQQVGIYFEPVQDYMLVVNPKGRILFMSEEARTLSYDALQQLQAPLEPLPGADASGSLSLPGAPGLRYRVAPINDAGPEVAAVLVAAPREVVAYGPADLLRSMLILTPLVLLLAWGLGWWLAGRAVAPLAPMLDEIQAVTDGRSLHRRVAVPPTGDELARLATKVNEMLSRLEHSFSSLRRFTADASHELKTPLQVLRAGVERALTHPGAPPESIEALDETLNQINAMSELVEHLLTLARADEGAVTLAVEPCDLRDVLADVVETAGLLGDQSGIKVASKAPMAPVVVPVDRARIRQMLMNLATNAVKYTPNGGRVDLELSEAGRHVTLVVRDNGIGIAPGDLPHIFDRFWRADVARSRTGERAGAGLGLAITKWIAEAHGGNIAVQSRPGRGTVFTITLPKDGAPLKEIPAPVEV